MHLLLTGRAVEITPTLRQLVERKLTKIDRVLHDGVVSTQVVLTRERHRCLSEVTVHARGDHMLHGLGGASQWQASLGQAVEKVSQQAQKLKDKRTTRKRRATSARASSLTGLVAPASEESLQTPRIVRTPSEGLKPMTVADAALQIDVADRGFLVFRNARTDAVNVLFRRKDGRLGLIEPEGL